MKKLRKFLRLLLLLLPFSLMSTAFAVSEHAGGTSYGGTYQHWTYDGDTNVSWDNLTYEHSRDPQWVTQLRRDVANNSLSPSFMAQASEFLLLWNYTHYFGTTDDVPGEAVESDNWLDLSEFRFQFSVLGHYPNSPSQWVFCGSGYTNVSDFVGNNTYSFNVGVYEGAILNVSKSGMSFTFDTDLSNYSESDWGFIFDGRVKMEIQLAGTNYNYDGKQFYIYSDSGSILSVNPFDSNTGNYLNGWFTTSSNNSGMYIKFTVVSNSEDGNFSFYFENVDIGGVTAPDTPELSYPEGNSTTNNYYDKEVNYYNYMTNATDILEDKVDASYLEDVQEWENWGLLSLPPGLCSLALEALGDYSSVCEFHFSGIAINVGDGQVLRVPPMHFEFDADDYGWLIPFRYLIALSLCLGLSYVAWDLICSIVNWGSKL